MRPSSSEGSTWFRTSRRAVRRVSALPRFLRPLLLGERVPGGKKWGVCGRRALCPAAPSTPDSSLHHPLFSPPRAYTEPRRHPQKRGDRRWAALLYSSRGCPTKLPSSVLVTRVSPEGPRGDSTQPDKFIWGAYICHSDPQRGQGIVQSALSSPGSPHSQVGAAGFLPLPGTY